jgi:biofilm PGA synthesis N-glycosyltransferase PgaC
MGATGAVYAMRRSLARPLPPETLLDDMYLPLGAFFSGYRVLFEERAHAYDVPASLKTEFQRKVRTQAGVYQIIRFYPSLLGPRNRMWLHFMSHKVGRLLLPFALLAVGISSIWLPAPLAGVALIGQAGFYTLAILDLWLPERMPLKRLTSPIRTFVTLMMAAFCALAIVFVDAQTLWKTPGQRR